MVVWCCLWVRGSRLEAHVMTDGREAVASQDKGASSILVDNLLQQAHGVEMGRMIAGSYRLATTIAEMKSMLDQQAAEIARLEDMLTIDNASAVAPTTAEAVEPGKRMTGPTSR